MGVFPDARPRRSGASSDDEGRSLLSRVEHQTRTNPHDQPPISHWRLKEDRMPEGQIRQTSRRGGWRGRTLRKSLLLAVLLSTLIAGAGFAVQAVDAQGAQTSVAGCFDPIDFGAKANDGVDDRVPIQAAIDAAIAAGRGTVCLGSG